MITYSKYNILFKIYNSNKYCIVNPLYQNADIISKQLYNNIIENKIPEKYYSLLLKKNYIIDPEEETIFFNNKYLEFLNNFHNDEIQIFFVPTYNCNFNCSYCYQKSYNSNYNPSLSLSKKIIDSFFTFINTNNNFINRKKYITLFGGEPLLTSNTYKKSIEYIFSKTVENNLQLAIVTNGYNIVNYSNILKYYHSNIREIQVTLDGTEKTHNIRRKLKSGKGSFSKIIDGINFCLDNNIPVNLRIVIDKENIDNLVELSMFAEFQNWTSNPLFKTQLGRNYELHSCYYKSDLLFNRLQFHINIYNIIKKHPHFLEFHKPDFSISKYLFENNQLPSPLFDSCPACKNEWAFDYTGRIYSCTATVGKKDEELGRFFPSVTLNTKYIQELQNRDICSIPQCKNCNISLICGGGCFAIAKNNTGNIYSPDCRPIKDIMSMGFDIYNLK